MNFSSDKPKHKLRIFTTSVVLFLAILLLACAVYLNDYYHTDMDAVETFTATSNIEFQTLENDTIVFEPEEATKGFIFYPGGKVEYTAYLPLMQLCAEQDILCVLVKMPCNLAVLDIDAADGIQEQYPDIQEWYIGGHSLGGSMAASYLSKHTNDYEGLILLGSYSTADLSSTNLNVLSIFGSEDKVLNHEKYDENISNLPEDFVEVVINGGCHAYFGMYGAQDGDGTPTIRCEEQLQESAAVISNFMY